MSSAFCSSTFAVVSVSVDFSVSVSCGLAVGFGDVDFDVGFYAKFGDVAFCIADDGGRETHTLEAEIENLL